MPNTDEQDDTALLFLRRVVMGIAGRISADFSGVARVFRTAQVCYAMRIPARQTNLQKSCLLAP